MVSISFIFIFFSLILFVSCHRHFRGINDIHDPKHGIKMGEFIQGCDDAKTNLAVDWNFSQTDYVCPTPKNPIPILPHHGYAENCHKIDPNYMPQHFCMNQTISYDSDLPTFGDHRPLWPIFGEYQYVPAQRWLHNIEHGAVVMLYHPCTHPAMVNKLRALVTRCIWKNVITPWPKLTDEYPLALITWGCSLKMNTVNSTHVIDFIKRTALHGPEGHYSKQGQYQFGLLKPSTIPFGSDIDDSNLCPNL